MFVRRVWKVAVAAALVALAFVPSAQAIFTCPPEDLLGCFGL
jgi:hypothetical protein